MSLLFTLTFDELSNDDYLGEKNIYAKFHSADINVNRESTMILSIFQFAGIVSSFG